MSETSTPAGGTGGGEGTSARPELAELPAKVRVHALAKLLSRSSREVMDALTELGQPARSAQSSVTKDTALRIADALLGPAEAAPAEPVKQAPPPTPVFATASPLFLPPTEAPAPRPARAKVVEDEPAEPAAATDDESATAEDPDNADNADNVDNADNADGPDGSDGSDDGEDGARRRRRRGRRGRGRGKGGADDGSDEPDQSEDNEPKTKAAKTAKAKAADSARAEQAGKADKTEKAEKPDKAEKSEDAEGEDGTKRRRRRRRRKGNGEADADASTEDDPPNTVVHVRESRDAKPESGRDEVRSVRGSTRLEAKRQRRRDGREAGRRRAPILSEAEFLARREAVDRTMVVREQTDRTQIAVLEDGVLVEHFVTSAGSGSMVGNVYLGRVQNVLPSMEAAFVDIGRGRNAVLYAGEVDWDAAGLEGKARRIEQALSTGDSVLVQVTKDPVGHKGARLTTQISLPGRFLVYVPGGGATGISRKLPENERRRLKDVLKRIVPEDAGVIIRTASEGISEDELARDVRRLQAQWQVIKDKVEADKASKGKKSSAPTLLYEEPDLLVKVVRDLFTEDFAGLVVQGADAWDTIDAYVRHVAPELTDRVRKHIGPTDVFAEHRIDEQLLKALDRKVWLPSGGYLVIDRTEAMTVIDVNTGKFTGSGGNLEETVTRNNLESAEEIVRQLRLRDIGGIIVIDFIDMVLESNRDLVLRRLTECLGRDRTRHQVAEVTSLGLVQMTRKRVGTGLLEAFSTPCEHCKGRGVIVSTDLESAGGNGHQHHHGGGNGKRGGRENGKGGKDSPAPRDAASHAPAVIEPTVTARTGQDGQAAKTGADTTTPEAATATSSKALAGASTGSSPEAATAREAATGTPSEALAGASTTDAQADTATGSSVETPAADVQAAETSPEAPAAPSSGSSVKAPTAREAAVESSSSAGAADASAAPSGTPAAVEADMPSEQSAEAPAGTPAVAPVGASEPSADPRGTTADTSPEAVERPTRRRRHGKVVRPAGAPAAVTAPAVEVAVPTVPEGQSRVITAPDVPRNGHDTSGTVGAEGVAASHEAPSASDAGRPAEAALPRRHQPRRAVSRPAGPPVQVPGEPS